MADQTHGAVDSLLGLLSKAIKDEANLLGGIQGDMQFIKDEMDSMNGFLLHMTKMKMVHNDQHRAWMKQIRDITYIAQDCIAHYMLDLSPPDKGFWALVRHFPVYLWTMPKRHRLATKFRELKVRVGEVGERRLRYGVTVPETEKQPKRSKPAGQDDKDIDQKRKYFLCALGLEDVQETTPPPHEPFNNAIELLLKHTASQYYAETTIRSVVKKCMPDVHTSKMFLCALHADPYDTEQELDELEKKLKDRAVDVRNEVMIFCYSKLSTHSKSCLQYLTAFHEETSISRTSLVRRWVAEGLVAKEEENQTLEEAAEHCFSELVFRGFIRPYGTGSAGKVKSCTIDNSVWSFVLDISKSENFVANKPFHLERQLHIRDIVKRQWQRLQQEPRGGDRSNAPQSACGLCASRKHQQEQPTGGDMAAEGNDPMNELVVFLKGLPEFYRLNVMDLGGCRGLKKRHLKSICKVVWLKYLSLRNTDVSHLPKQIKKLKLLETLDIRQTEVRASGTLHIFPHNLKHLLAGHIDESKELLSTVRMPSNIERMTNMEILSRVQVSHGGVKLEEVGRLPRLRKLGVVLQGTEKNVKHLIRAIIMLSARLRSLSIWINNGETLNMNMDEKEEQHPTSSLESLNINGLGGIGLLDWIRRLHKLSNITLCETKLTSLSVDPLGKLGGLRCLRLRHGSCIEPTLTFKADEFQSLKFLLIEDDKITGIAFEHGAAPKLEKIVWWCFTSMDITSDTISGVDQLPMLKVVELKGHCNCRLHRLQKAIAALPTGTTEVPAADAARDITVTATCIFGACLARCSPPKPNQKPTFSFAI